MANKYWVGGSGNVSDNTNHWSDSDGGAAGAVKPASADAVFITVNSGTAGFVITVDETFPATGVVSFDTTGANAFTLAQGASALGIGAAVTTSAFTHTVTTGTLTNTGAFNMTNGGSLGSLTAWTLTQTGTATFTVGATATFNSPRTWTSTHTITINSSASVNNNTTALTHSGNVFFAYGGKSLTDFTIANSGTGLTLDASDCTVEGTLTINASATFYVAYDDNGATRTLTMGTASSAGAIVNNGTFYLVRAVGTPAGAIKAASSAYPWTFTGTAPNLDGPATTNYLWDGNITPNLTTGTTAAETFDIRSMTFGGTLTIASGDTWKSISSTYQGAITATGTFASCNHNRLNHYVYGKAGQIKLSTLNDAQFCPKNGSAIYVLNGELYVDRGPFNETLAPTTAPVYRYILSDACHHANANLSFADGIQVRLPKGWSRFGTGVLGGSRKNVAFRCVFQYGFEGETAGANPALGTTTEGAGGGAIDVSASNPETGLNSLDVNQPAAASGNTTWASPTLSPTIVRGVLSLSGFTHSTMATSSIIEEIEFMLHNGAIGATTIGPNVAWGNGLGSYKFYNITGGGAGTKTVFTVDTTYAASTRYNIVIAWDCASDLYLVTINGVTVQADVAFRAVQTAIATLTLYSDQAFDGRLLFDNIIVCNLDVDTVAKSLSGGWADLDDASLATPSETPAANLRIPVIDLPAGVVY